MRGIRKRIDAETAALDEPRLTRDLAGSRVAHLASGANRAGIGALAIGRSTAVISVGGRIHADAAAIDEARLTRKRACSPGANLAGGARGSPVGPLTVRRRAAVVDVGIGVDARAVAIDESRLARQAANAVVANLSRRTGGTGIAPMTV